MGWLFLTGASRKEVIADCLESTEATKPLRHCLRGNILWVLRETQTGAGVIRWIDCVLLQKDNYTGDWGYKDMDESMYPYYFTCPLAYLDTATEPRNSEATDWRAAVRSHHKEKATARKAARVAHQPRLL